MYQEGHRGFAFKSIILKILFIVVLIFLIIWLFPTKNYVKNLIDQKLGTNTNQIFNTNIETMKNAATSYFNGDRLPEKVDQSKTLTLREMIDKNLLVDFTDSNNKKCNYKKSYAKVTKTKSDYKLKVNLACTDKTAYIYSYIGDKNTSDVYSKKKLAEKSETNDNEETDTKTKEECKYVKKGGYISYGSWSNWSTTPVDKTNTREVETKQEKVATGEVTEEEGTIKHTQNPKKVTLNKDGKQYTVYVCPADFDNGGSYNNFVTCVKTVPNYVNKTTYRNVTYYRYRDGKYISNDSYKTSNCNDTNLLNQGYTKI